jgi:hypothetical protein
MFALQVRVLVEEGKADLAVMDRWGATPLDEAMRAGCRTVMDFLQVRALCQSAPLDGRCIRRSTRHYSVWQAPHLPAKATHRKICPAILCRVKIMGWGGVCPLG